MVYHSPCGLRQSVSLDATPSQVDSLGSPNEGLELPVLEESLLCNMQGLVGLHRLLDSLAGLLRQVGGVRCETLGLLVHRSTTLELSDVGVLLEVYKEGRKDTDALERLDQQKITGFICMRF